MTVCLAQPNKNRKNEIPQSAWHFFGRADCGIFLRAHNARPFFGATSRPRRVKADCACLAFLLKSQTLLRCFSFFVKCDCADISRCPFGAKTFLGAHSARRHKNTPPLFAAEFLLPLFFCFVPCPRLFEKCRHQILAIFFQNPARNAGHVV